MLLVVAGTVEAERCCCGGAGLAGGAAGRFGADMAGRAGPLDLAIANVDLFCGVEKEGEVGGCGWVLKDGDLFFESE